MGLDFLGKGLKFPFRFERRSGGAMVSTATSLEQAHIHESILQILGTRPGERFMRPDFGSRVRDLVFEQNDTVLRALLRHWVIDAITRWEKRVPEEVFQGIEAVRLEGRTNMLDYPAVIHLARGAGHHAAADWIMVNVSAYSAGVFRGFVMSKHDKEA